MLKVLYESVIGPDTRKELGEYYTPDWLARAMVEDVYTDPLTTRALDPSCGSGTFLFQCATAYLRQAAASGRSLADVANLRSAYLAYNRSTTYVTTAVANVERYRAVAFPPPRPVS